MHDLSRGHPADLVYATRIQRERMSGEMHARYAPELLVDRAFVDAYCAASTVLSTRCRAERGFPRPGSGMKGESTVGAGRACVRVRRAPIQSCALRFVVSSPSRSSARDSVGSLIRFATLTAEKRPADGGPSRQRQRRVSGCDRADGESPPAGPPAWPVRPRPRRCPAFPWRARGSPARPSVLPGPWPHRGPCRGSRCRPAP